MRHVFSAIFLLSFLLVPFAWAAGERAVVRSVIDGDTLSVTFRGENEHVRLIGIDTPEARQNNKARRDSQRSGQDLNTITTLGKAASRESQTLAHKGDVVTLEFDAEQRDKYGRLLAYVYLPNGKMINEELLREGYALVMTRPPNVRYAERFKKIYDLARRERRGLWKEN